MPPLLGQVALGNSGPCAGEPGQLPKVGPRMGEQGTEHRAHPPQLGPQMFVPDQTPSRVSGSITCQHRPLPQAATLLSSSSHAFSKYRLRVFFFQSSSELSLLLLLFRPELLRVKLNLVTTCDHPSSLQPNSRYAPSQPAAEPSPLT